MSEKISLDSSDMIKMFLSDYHTSPHTEGKHLIQ